MNKQPKVLIFGSCVSRDVIEYSKGTQRSFELVDYYARCSMGSLSRNRSKSKAMVRLENVPSNFQRRMVERDLDKSILNALRTQDYHLLLVDLIDERFNLWVSPSDDVFTVSNEFIKTGYLTEGHPGKMLVSGTEEFWQLWQLGWKNFLQILKNIGKEKLLVINQVYWSETTVTGDEFQKPFTRSMISQANRLLDRMYRCMAEDLCPHQFLTYSKDELLSSEAHRWGCSPFHYADKYYAVAVEKLACFLDESSVGVDMGLRRGFSHYDLSRWGGDVYCHDSVDGLDPFSWADGVHRFFISGRQSLDILVKNFSSFSSRETPGVLYVALSGAVSNRSGKAAPFFSGVSMSSNFDGPFIAISDPVLAFDGELPLGWYAGYSECRNLPGLIAQMLDEVSGKLGCDLLLFGGSGGGYASLRISSLLRRPASVFVWNPQTSISEYVPSFVAKYIGVAFPEVSERIKFILEAPDSTQSALLSELFFQLDVHFDVTNIIVPDNVKVLILQNRSDWHVERHTKPFMKGRRWSKVGADGYVESVVGNIGVYFGEWGRGHVAPDKSVILDVIFMLRDGGGVRSIVANFDGGVSGSFDKKIGVGVGVESRIVDPSLEVKAYCKEGVISVLCHCDRSSESDRFAFYLLRDGIRIDMRWYEESGAATFFVDSSLAGLEVVAFMRDRLGNQFSKRVGVISAGLCGN